MLFSTGEQLGILLK